MALHGDIRVNGRVIADWSATRTLTHDSGRHQYECEVTRYRPLDTPDHPGDTYAEIPRQFTLWHEYDDGAEALAAAVLKHASAPPTGDTR